MAHEDISGYSLRRGLGSGSAGTVWLLRDRATGRHAVLKRIPKAAVPAPTDFLGDLKLARTIDHPHIARLHEVRETDREWLLFSQYVAAGTLTSLLERRGVLTPGELVTLISPLAQALSLLHRTGLPHGRLTADNIMFDADGRPVITDAGLRTLCPPATPESDLQALAAIAQASGSDPKTFPPSLFTTPDHLAHHALHQSHPLPIDLGFTPDHDPITSHAAPDPVPTLVSAPRQQPQPPSPTPTPSPTSTRAGNHLPRPTHRKPGATKSAARKSALRRSGRPTARQPRQPGQSGQPRQSGRARRSLDHRPTSQAVWQFLRTKRAAYGILAACGAGALATLAIGLATLGVLGDPADTSTAAANQSTHPTPQPTPTPSRTPSPHPTGAQGIGTHPTGANSSKSPRPRATSGTPSHRPQSARSADDQRWLEVLQGLDTSRSRAFARLDTRELTAVYVDGSPPWTADRELIATYRGRHLRVEGLRVEIKNLTVETANPKTVVLRIVDRLVSGAAVSDSGQRTAFPPGTPTARRVTLTAKGADWRISAIATVWRAPPSKSKVR